MCSWLMLVGLVVVGQVSTANDRYGATDQRPDSFGIDSPASKTDSGLVPMLEAAPGDTPTQPLTSRSSNNTDPYAPSTAAPGGATQQAPPPSGAAAPAGSSSPPPGYGERTQPPASPSNTRQATQSTGLKPSAMMRAMLTPPGGSRLAGRPVSLADVVASAASRAEQTQRVEAYWDLCSSVADYYLGLREQDELRRLRASVPSLGPAGEQAENELAVRIGTSQRAALASQYRLASWINEPGFLPLPADIPHCGSYHSYYEQIFAGRPSAEAQELSALLPLRYAELKDAATAVTRAEEWLNAVASARIDNADATGTLRAMELLALRRRAFVQIARDYNRRIARYSELATPGPIDAERLIGMLIKRDSASTATRPTSAPLNRQSQSRADSPRSTFAEGWTPAGSGRTLPATRDEAVQPASGEMQSAPRQERSLLVPRQ